MHDFYISCLPKFMLSRFQRQTAWHSEVSAFKLCSTSANRSAERPEGAVGAGPSGAGPSGGGAQWGGAAEAAMWVGPSGKALCFGSALFRADMLSPIFIYLTSHRKISLERRLSY